MGMNEFLYLLRSNMCVLLLALLFSECLHNSGNQPHVTSQRALISPELVATAPGRCSPCPLRLPHIAVGGPAKRQFQQEAKTQPFCRRL